MALRKFEIGSIKDNSVILIFGRRGTGKSTLINDILSHHPDISGGTIVSGATDVAKFRTCTGITVHSEYNPVIIRNFLARQKSAADPRAFLVLDNCLYDTSWTKNADIQTLFMNNTMLIIAMAYASGIPANLRANTDYIADYICILPEKSEYNRRLIYEKYGQIFPDFETFCQIMDQYTESTDNENLNYGCIIIDNTEDQLYWYKAENAIESSITL